MNISIKKRRGNGRFSRQESYGVFSYSRSHIGSVVKYVLNQEQHHQKKSFRNEYHSLMQKFELPFKERYLFEFIGNERVILELTWV